MALSFFKNTKVHKKKCHNHITLMVIPDPTKQPKVIKIPKWFRYPVMAAVILLVLSGMYLMDHLATVEYQEVTNQHYHLMSRFALEDQETVIDALEQSNQAHYEKLITLEALQKELQGYLEDIQAYKQELNQMIHGADIADVIEVEAFELIEGTPETEALIQTEEPRYLVDGNVIYELDPYAGIDREFLTAAQSAKTTSSEDWTRFESDYDRLFSQVQQSIELLNIQEVELLNLDDELESLIPYWEAMPAGMPVKNAYVTSAFGWRVHPVYRRYRFHYGVDIRARYVSVYATGKGVVTSAKYESGMGNTVTIDHGFGYQTKYAHLSKFHVSVGDTVMRGDKIATSGNSGVSSGAHLHYEVILDDVQVDPAPYLN